MELYEGQGGKLFETLLFFGYHPVLWQHNYLLYFVITGIPIIYSPFSKTFGLVNSDHLSSAGTHLNTSHAPSLIEFAILLHDNIPTSFQQHPCRELVLVFFTSRGSTLLFNQHFESESSFWRMFLRPLSSEHVATLIFYGGFYICSLDFG